MPIDEIWSHLFTGIGGRRRFTQDSPVLPDVWAHFLEHTRGAADLLLTPWRSTTPTELVAAAQNVYPEPAPIGPARGSGGQAGPIGYFVPNETFVAVRLTLEDVAIFVVPFSGWWQQRIARHIDTISRLDRTARRSPDRRALLRSLAEPGSRHVSPLPPQVVWWIRVLGTVSSVSAGAPGVPSPEVQLRLAATLSRKGRRAGADRHPPCSSPSRWIDPPTPVWSTLVAPSKQMPRRVSSRWTVRRSPGRSWTAVSISHIQPLLIAGRSPPQRHPRRARRRRAGPVPQLRRLPPGVSSTQVAYGRCSTSPGCDGSWSSPRHHTRRIRIGSRASSI